MDLIAIVVSLVAVVAALGYDGYLALLTSVARRRPGGEPIVRAIRSRWVPAAITTVTALLALLIAGGGVVSNVFAIVIAGVSGMVAIRNLQGARQQLSEGGRLEIRDR